MKTLTETQGVSSLIYVPAQYTRFERKINKIEANLLASTLGSLAYFQRFLQSSLL
jgi:hypothetical protein